MFKPNESLLDRVIRALAGIALLIIALWTNGALATISFILGIALLITAAIGYCGFYAVCHFSTLTKKTEPTPLPTEPTITAATETEAETTIDPIAEPNEVSETTATTQTTEPTVSPDATKPETDKASIANN